MKKGDLTKCDCGHMAESDGFSTGYGIDKDGKKICFACCGEQDKQTLIETGKLSGYFSKDEKGHYFGNWPGSFKIRVYSVRYSWHNFAGRNGRRDFWLTYNGENYHGVNIGDQECATIKRVKK